MEKKLTVRVKPHCKSIKKQLIAQGYYFDDEEIRSWQRAAYALYQVHGMGLIDDEELEIIGCRISKKVIEIVEEFNKNIKP